MRHAFGTAILLAMLALGMRARAQDEETVVRTHVERPPEGSMRRGSLPMPAWAVYAGAGLAVSVAAGVLVLRIARRR